LDALSSKLPKNLMQVSKYQIVDFRAISIWNTW
jgi:hypothetical protein